MTKQDLIDRLSAFIEAECYEPIRWDDIANLEAFVATIVADATPAATDDYK